MDDDWDDGAPATTIPVVSDFKIFMYNFVLF